MISHSLDTESEIGQAQGPGGLYKPEFKSWQCVHVGVIAYIWGTWLSGTWAEWHVGSLLTLCNFSEQLELSQACFCVWYMCTSMFCVLGMGCGDHRLTLGCLPSVVLYFMFLRADFH